MDDKEIKRRFDLWNIMNSKVVMGLNKAVERVDKLEKIIKAMVNAFYEGDSGGG